MRRFGASADIEGTTFRLWAPNAAKVELLRPEKAPQPMERAEEGFFHCSVPGVMPGALYRFRADGVDVPDPASRGQDKDADGWSVVAAPMPPGRNAAIRPWHEAVIAEVHVGAATEEGTFAALARRLDHWAMSGFTALEIMPVADFMGARNWGYDGVLPFAPDRAYGPPEDLRALVDAAHLRGLAIVLDVVYNHFGPSGNYLHHYARDFFAEDELTPWGPAIALDNPIVRDFFCANVRMWLEEYDMDGLRFDAVHAFRTEGVPLFMEALAETARAVKPDAWLILENDENAARWLARDGARPRHFTAQWNDDFHHVFAVLGGQEPTAHFADYADGAAGKAARALAEGFVYQGEESPHRGLRRGEPSRHLPPTAFVSFTQNHDQIGNRPMGDRAAARLPPQRLEAMRFVTALSPQIPLYFMGEEAGLDKPFPFFCDFEGDLADAVREGRREEFRPFFETHRGSPDDLPDPLAEETFLSAKLDWPALEREPRRSHLARFRALMALRRDLVWPLLADAYRGAEAGHEGSVFAVTWRFASGSLTLIANFADHPGRIDGPDEPPAATLGSVSRDGRLVLLGPWAAALWHSAGAGATS
jgi:maltooligosyltrehalose trehalohydrolase